MRAFQLYKILTIVVLVVLLNSCQQTDANSPGSEYMPDMAHSIAYEANYYNYYYNNTWGTEEEYHKMAMPRTPVPGTVPTSASSHMRIPANGSSAYAFGDSDEERLRATSQLIDNPHAITDEGLKRGKMLYDINCAICHGEKGDGNGYLLRDDGGKYPVQPAILTNDEFTATSNGRLYHAIVYGKNVMGGYTDKLATEERWQVIHYIRSLQAKNKELVYNQTTNTLNGVDRPAGDMKNTLLGMNEGNHDSDDHGSHDGEGHEGHDHEGHDHEGHDHEGHDHDGGEHDGQDHDEKH